MTSARQKEKIPGHAKAIADKVWCRHYKNRPKKYVVVCANCYYRNSCKEYNQYLREKENEGKTDTI